jgi:mono/diheme cytochrome c family protein
MRRIAILILLVSVVAAAGAAIQKWPLDPATSISTGLKGDPDRGAYLARMSGCIGCHTSTDEDAAVLAGGPPLETPFGIFYAPNITPDLEHGVGNWSLEDFDQALRHGVSPEGEPYYPAFPYAFYTKLSDQDVADIWAAVWTVPPVAETSRPHQLSWPFNQRAGIKLWRTLYFSADPFVPEPTESDLWNRGRFIVTGPAHCGACHTPRNLLGARDHEQHFLGEHDLPGGHTSPSIRSSDLQDAGWTEKDIAFALRTGLTPDGDSLGGSMGEVIQDSTSWLSDSDLDAIATYLLHDNTGQVE